MILYRTICCWSVVFALIYPAKRVIPATVLYIESVCNSYIGRNKIKGEAYSDNDCKKIH